MAISKWCDTDKWYYDENMNIHSFSLPRNELDEVVIQEESITYNIIQNGCFGKILALKCQDITVINGSDQIPAPILDFSCALLRGNRATINRDVRLSHWQTNEFITYEVDILTLGNNTEVNYAILSMTSGIFNGGTLSTVIIDADSMICSGTTIADSIKPSTITCASGLFTNFNGNGKKTKYNGNFTISSGVIDGSGNGNFIFDNGAINYATINGTAVFSGAAENRGIIFSDTSFSGSSINYGVIVGKSDFMDDSYNMGIVSGSTTFTSGSYNSGIITGNSLFYSGTVNYGRVSGETSFYYATNEGNISNNTKLYYSTNNGMISGDLASFNNSLNSDNGTVRSVQVDFDNFSSNVGTIGKPTSPNNQNDIGETMQVTFGTGCLNNAMPDPSFTGVVNLNPTGNGIFFTKDSINVGFLNANKVTFGDISKNDLGNQCYGMPNPFVTIKEPDTITAIYSFNKFSKNYCASTFPSSILVIFNDYSTNIDGVGSIVNAVFNNRSINSGNSIEYGVFNNTSINSGTVTTSGIFNNSSQNGGTLPNSGVFYNSSFNNSSGNVENGIFRDNSINLGGSGDRLCFCDNSKNSGNCNILNCELSSINLSGSHTAITAAFSGSSINMESGTCLFTFRGNSINKGILTTLPETFVNFYDDSINNNYANYANFYDRSRNSATSSGISGTFYNQSSNQGFLEQGFFTSSGSVNNIPGVVIDSVFDDKSINYSSMRRSPTYCTGNPCLPVALGSPAYWFYNLRTARPATTYGYRRMKIMGGAINQANLQNISLSVHDGGTNNGNISYNPHGLDDYNPIKLYFTTSGIFLSGITKQYTNTIDPPKLTLTSTALYVEPISDASFISAFFCGGHEYISGPAPSIAFTEYSVNNGNIQGYLHYAFSKSAKNYGSLTTFPVIPESHDSASFSGNLAPGLCVNSGYVQGSVTFTDAVNYGDLYHAIFNNDSYNFGSIYGSSIDTEYSYGCGLLSVKNEITFTDSFNFGLLNKYSVFDNSINFNTATINNAAFFKNHSVNLASITNSAYFKDSTNVGDVGGDIVMDNGMDIAASIRGDASFFNSRHYNISYIASLSSDSLNTFIAQNFFTDSNLAYLYSSMMDDGTAPYRSLLLRQNAGVLFGNVLFSGSNNYGADIKGSGSFINNSENYGVVYGSSLFDSSINASIGVLKGPSIIMNYSINSGHIESNESDRSEWIDNQLSGIMINASFTTLFGVVFDNSINRGVIDTKTLLNHSTNESIINKSAVFISSINNQSQSLTGVINGDSIFYNHSDNNSLINGNVIFHTFSNNTASGQIYGNAVFASGSCYSDSDQIYGEITDDGTCQ